MSAPGDEKAWDEKRCRVCGWTLAASRDEGCAANYDCSMRPMPTRMADGSGDTHAFLTEWHSLERRIGGTGKARDGEKRAADPGDGGIASRTKGTRTPGPALSERASDPEVLAADPPPTCPTSASAATPGTCGHPAAACQFTKEGVRCLWCASVAAAVEAEKTRVYLDAASRAGDFAEWVEKNIEPAVNPDHRNGQIFALLLFADKLRLAAEIRLSKPGGPA